MDNGDSFKKVRSGEPMVIPANFYNALVDVVGWVRRQQQSQAAGLTQQPDQRCVLARNDSGGNLPAQSVLGISSVVFDPTAGANQLASFLDAPVLAGATPALPTHAGKFVVLAEPINAGAIGQAYASGTCAVKVNITSSSHQFADVTNGNVAYLSSSESGAAAILWRQASTGNVWCVVRFGGGGGGGGIHWGKIASVAGDKLSCVVHPCTDRNGTSPDTGTNVTVYVPAIVGGAVKAIVVTGDVIAYSTASDDTSVAVSDYLGGSPTVVTNVTWDATNARLVVTKATVRADIHDAADSYIPFYDCETGA